MGWVETTLDVLKEGEHPTTAELEAIYVPCPLDGAPSLEVLASAHKAHGPADGDYHGYTLWLYGKPLCNSWAGPEAIAETVQLLINWAGREVMFRSFGLDVGHVPPVSFLEALPESLGDVGADEQLVALREMTGCL